MISSSPTKKPGGWTLIELVSVMLILAILVKFMSDTFSANLDGAKTDATLQRLEAMKSAILGADYALTNEGVRTTFGFVGDVGRLPASLAELSSQGTLPTWVYSTSNGIGAGWRGPYLSGSDSLSASAQKDAWGRAVVYSTVLPTPTLTSLGADGVAGGASANTDVAMELGTSLWQSRLSGNVRDGNQILSTAIVGLTYPVDGTLASVTTTADANGYYQFSNVPFGVRSLRVISPTVYGPSPVVVQKSEFQVPDTALNFRGGAEVVSYQTGTVKNYLAGTNILVLLQSSYSLPVQLASVTISWAGGGNYSKLTVNGIALDISPVVTTGTVKAIDATMVLPAQSTANTFELTFSADMTGRVITVVLGWRNQTRTDTVSFTP